MYAFYMHQSYDGVDLGLITKEILKLY
jgi:hypothetical protein